MIDLIKSVTIDLPTWAIVLWLYINQIETLLLRRKVEKLHD